MNLWIHNLYQFYGKIILEFYLVKHVPAIWSVQSNARELLLGPKNSFYYHIYIYIYIYRERERERERVKDSDKERVSI